MFCGTINLAATGKKITELRKARNLRVIDISEFMGFEAPQAVYKWQRGESLPSVDNLVALSILFGVTMEDILVIEGGAENAPPFNFSYWREPPVFYGFFQCVP